MHRGQHVKECMKTIALIRKSENLAENLGINEVKLGQAIYKKSLSEEEREALNDDNMISDDKAKSLFV